MKLLFIVVMYMFMFYLIYVCEFVVVMVDEVCVLQDLSGGIIMVVDGVDFLFYVMEVCFYFYYVYCGIVVQFICNVLSFLVVFQIYGMIVIIY